MCTSYESTNPNDAAEAFSLFPAPDFDYPHEIYKDYFAPIFRADGGRYTTDPASFALVPRKRIPKGVKPFDTMNARVESLTERRNFKGVWLRQQLCLVPCTTFFEPNYETGSPVRWRIGLASGAPLTIAGLWREWEISKDAHGAEDADQGDGGEAGERSGGEGDETSTSEGVKGRDLITRDGKAYSFTMLTVNAEHHPLMRRFHKPNDEKRSLVIIPPDERENWLSCRSTDEALSFMRLYPAELMHAEPYPLPPRKRKATPAPQKPNAKAGNRQSRQSDLF